MKLEAADRWRVVAALVTAVCLILALTLRAAILRAQAAERRAAGAIFDCYVSPEDRDHQGLGR